MFAKLTADYYGAQTPLQQLATFQVPDARMVLITPYDTSSMTAIEKSIRDSDLGVNPSNDGNVIRVTLPQLTEERRKEYIKLARHKAEDARISVRNARRTPRTRWTRWSRTRKSARTRWPGPRSSSTPGRPRTTSTSIDDVLKHKEAELLEV